MARCLQAARSNFLLGAPLGCVPLCGLPAKSSALPRQWFPTTASLIAAGPAVTETAKDQAVEERRLESHRGPPRERLLFASGCSMVPEPWWSRPRSVRSWRSAGRLRRWGQPVYTATGLGRCAAVTETFLLQERPDTRLALAALASGGQTASGSQPLGSACWFNGQDLRGRIRLLRTAWPDSGETSLLLGSRIFDVGWWEAKCPSSGRSNLKAQRLAAPLPTRWTHIWPRTLPTHWHLGTPRLQPTGLVRSRTARPEAGSGAPMASSSATRGNC